MRGKYLRPEMEIMFISKSDVVMASGDGKGLLTTIGADNIAGFVWVGMGEG